MSQSIEEDDWLNSKKGKEETDNQQRIREGQNVKRERWRWVRRQEGERKRVQAHAESVGEVVKRSGEER